MLPRDYIAWTGGITYCNSYCLLFTCDIKPLFLTDQGATLIDSSQSILCNSRGIGFAEPAAIFSCCHKEHQQMKFFCEVPPTWLPRRHVQARVVFYNRPVVRNSDNVLKISIQTERRCLFFEEPNLNFIPYITTFYILLWNLFDELVCSKHGERYSLVIAYPLD